MQHSEYKSAQDFVTKMELGHFDGGHSRFSEEVRKLSAEQMEEIAAILTERY